MSDDISKMNDDDKAGAIQDITANIRYLMNGMEESMKVHLRLAFLAPAGVYPLWLEAQHTNINPFTEETKVKIAQALADEKNLVTDELANVVINHLCTGPTLIPDEDDLDVGETVESTYNKWREETREAIRKFFPQLAAIVTHRYFNPHHETPQELLAYKFSDFDESEEFMINFVAATVRSTIHW